MQSIYQPSNTEGFFSCSLVQGVENNDNPLFRFILMPVIPIK